MKVFRERLQAALAPLSGPTGRRWIYVAYDQLTDQVGPLSHTSAEELAIILVENPDKAARRPYHKQKLAYVLSNMRHFALEQAARGVWVEYLVGCGSYASILEPFLSKVGPAEVMRPAEWELRQELSCLFEQGLLREVPHGGWLSSTQQFLELGPAPWRMDAFYRVVRRATGILMQNGKPLGGKWSYDAENRLPWKGQPATPAPPTFAIDPIKQEVEWLLHHRFAHHPGRLDMGAVPSTNVEALSLWEWAKVQCLPHFGPYEDAMTVHSASLFHTRISPLLNLQRLSASQVVKEVEQLEHLALASKEGFIRQILGWREFVRHVHEQTEGFRQGVELSGATDGGYSRWSGKPWATAAHRNSWADPQFLTGAEQQDLPPAFWGAPSALACLDQVVSEVWQSGYSHHITRLMILSNIATLLGYSPRQLADWFWVAYIDAFDWVVEPNVLGMGTYATGPLMTTKPYVSGAAYINKMSDYCKKCGFDPKTNCPITHWYWAFLERNRAVLEGNPRMGVVMNAAKKRSDSQKKLDRSQFEDAVRILAGGQSLRPLRPEQSSLFESE